MEEQQSEQQPIETNDGKIQQWIQDNLRIIVSIVVVLVIAGGIYSYSKRAESPAITEDQSQITEESIEEGAVPSANENENAAKSKTAGEQPVAVSQETETSFIESATRGEGTTHLARRALANYLEKNPDSILTPEHKIYIEDFLRKNVGQKSGVRIGTSVEFSKDLIQEGIAKSKNLNERQLQNLHKYAVRVPSLT